MRQWRISSIARRWLGSGSPRTGPGRHRHNAERPLLTPACPCGQGFKIGHEGIDDGVHDVPGRWRQMCVAGSGPQTPMTQQFLKNPQRHPPFQEMGRIGVPQGMDGGIFGDPTLAHHRFERLLQGGGGQGHRSVPGRE